MILRIALLISLLGSALTVRAANAPAASPSPMPAAAPSPAVSGTGKLPGNDPALFANSLPLHTGPAVSGASPDSPSTSFAVDLLRRLVKKGILNQDDADQLTKEAQADVQSAHAQEQADASQASQAVVAQVTQKVQEMTPPPPSDDEVRVPYIPDNVKEEMASEVKNEVMQQARTENWASPRAIPDWVNHFRFSADVRTRYEGDFFPNTNDATGAFPNFNAINTGAPFDVAGTEFSPQYDVNQDRERFRFRARLGADVDLDQGFSMGIRLASGQDDSPVTENQTLGVANDGQGGNFSKYSVWLDRAFLKWEYEVDNDRDKDFSVVVGRQDNPFFGTTLVWARDLGFDGLTVEGRYNVGKGFTPFLTGGAYPVFNTDFNFASNQPSKYESEDKYLFAVQAGANWTINKDLNAKVAGALYYFENLEGHLSDPFVPLSASDQGNTDDSRPAFAQNGNTYFPIRDIIPTAQNDYGTIDQYQYYGLASPFHELDFTGQLNYDRFAPIRVSLIGEFVDNLAFNGSKIGAIAVNNRGPDTASGALGNFEGGSNGWIITLTAGDAALEKLWDWSVNVGYRYLQTDCTVDGFNDSDFGAPLYGTNLKGYTIGGNLALGERVWLGLTLMSADSIVGPPFKSDVVQFDINGKF
ncbi:MAG TPA: putative porin [Chthoniobacteraceae bacterium]|jgi:hypothetical protein|nr:putative porin [Chthoniobacteraceae bacterium]